MSTQLIDSLIREIEAKIDSTDLSPERVNSGEVISLGDGIAKVVGLREVAYNEVVEFESGARGVAMNLEENFVGVVVLSGVDTIKEGMIAKTTGRTLEIPVGNGLLGPPDLRRLAGYLGQVFLSQVQRLDVLLGFADADVNDDLGQLGHGHRRPGLELLHHGRDYVLDVLGLEPGDVALRHDVAEFNHFFGFLVLFMLFRFFAFPGFFVILHVGNTSRFTPNSTVSLRRICGRRAACRRTASS